MTIKEISIRNLMRRKGKAFFILAGLVISISTVVAVISFVKSMTNDINHKLEKYGANILIVPKVENLSLSYGGLSLGGVSFEVEEIREEELTRVNSIKNAANIAAMGPLVLGVVHIDNNRILLAGVDFKASKILKPWWRVKGTLPNENEILLGSETARVMSLDTGSPIEIKNRKLIVSGILHSTGSQDDQLIFAALSTAQSLLDKQGWISMAEVAALCTACPIDDMVKQISEVLPGAKVMAIQQVVKGRMETLSMFRKFSYGVSCVIMLVGSLVVLVTMTGSIRERTNEIGIFRAIGFRKRHIIQLVIIEAAIISCLAGILGYLLGLGATIVALRFFSETQSVSVLVNFNLMAGAFVLAVLTGISASIYPAIMAARLDPCDALRAL